MNELLSNLLIVFRAAIVFPLVAFLIHQWRLRKLNGKVKVVRHVTLILTLSVLLLDIMLIIFRVVLKEGGQLTSLWLTIPMLGITVYMYFGLWYAYKKFKEIGIEEE